MYTSTNNPLQTCPSFFFLLLSSEDAESEKSENTEDSLETQVPLQLQTSS